MIAPALTEVALPFPSGPVRNIFNPDVCTARELMVDRLAEAMGRDPLRLRRDFAKGWRAWWRSTAGRRRETTTCHTVEPAPG